MPRRLAIGVPVDGPIEWQRLFTYGQAADEAGVETVFVPETWGRDAFSILVRLAERTSRIKLATGIVNVFSRSPAALAQQFATLDEISNGRAIVGLGTSGARVVEHFHGVPFAPSATRLREVIEIVRLLLAQQPLQYKGRLFNLERGFTLRFTPLRSRLPIYLASFRPAGVRLTAELADGWLPLMIPIERLAEEVARVRALVTQVGRDPSALIVRAPGHVVVTNDPATGRQQHKRTVAYYLARMGDYYHTHLSEMGRAEDVTAIRAAWAAGGSATGTEAVSDDLAESLAAIGSVERCIGRLDEEAAAGVDLHQARLADDIAGGDLRGVFERLVG
jgi:alkanesulfonate monooxygenase SsuD/methylene tetrahydromethanopterin reductase-like flavin-dependent oxidoreductase (luciferase family)